MRAIPIKNPIFSRLDASLKDRWARRVLGHYAERAPGIVTLMTSSLDLVRDATPNAFLSLAAVAIQSAVRDDCGWYRFALEWCLVFNEDESPVTKAMRDNLLDELKVSLPPECARLVSGSAPPPKGHSCFSLPPSRPRRIRKGAEAISVAGL